MGVGKVAPAALSFMEPPCATAWGAVTANVSIMSHTTSRVFFMFRESPRHYFLTVMLQACYIGANWKGNHEKVPGKGEAQPRGCGRAAPRGWLARGVLLPALQGAAQELVVAKIADRRLRSREQNAEATEP